MSVGPAHVRDASGLLGDRYELDAKIGSGGMADVYRATDRLLDRVVAVKMLRNGAADAQERERFTTEARTLAPLNHPGLVTLLDAGILDEHPYLVMVLVDGPPLSDTIRNGGPMDPLRVADLGAQVADALHYAHGQGVVHRDVKPSNILQDADDRALLTDFGIARLLAETAHHTRTGETIGSPAYLSPEQVNGGPLTEAVDVYSLGLVLLEALTAQRAYPGTALEAAVARLSASPEIPESLHPGWRDLLTRMTDRDPAARPTAQEVSATLTSAFVAAAPEPATDTAVLDLTEPLDAGSTVLLSGTTLPVARRSRSPWLAIIGVVAAIVLGTILLWPSQTPARPAYHVPVGVPARMHQPLTDLHNAVAGVQR